MEMLFEAVEVQYGHLMGHGDGIDFRIHAYQRTDINSSGAETDVAGLTERRKFDSKLARGSQIKDVAVGAAIEHKNKSRLAVDAEGHVNVLLEIFERDGYGIGGVPGNCGRRGGGVDVGDLRERAERQDAQAECRELSEYPGGHVSSLRVKMNILQTA